MISAAHFSPDRLYRYMLLRRWDSSRPTAMFVGLNPSTADETLDDPTIRRCIRYAKDWGYGALLMGNIYALRSTDPKGLNAVEHPTGPDNDAWLEKMGRSAGIVVAAWGAWPGPVKSRPQRVAELFEKLHALGLTANGEPRHPLYMKADAQPQVWREL